MTAPLELRAGPLGRHHALPVLLLALCNVVAFAALLVRGSNSATGLVAAAVIAAGVLPILWWWGVRVATLVRLDGERLTWASPLRRGALPLGELRAVRRARFGLGHVVLVATDDRTVVILGGRRTGSFLRSLSAVAPDVEIPATLLVDADPGPRFRFDGNDEDAGR